MLLLHAPKADLVWFTDAEREQQYERKHMPALDVEPEPGAWQLSTAEPIGVANDAMKLVRTYRVGCVAAIEPP
jgi:hypothetical protein